MSPRKTTTPPKKVVQNDSKESAERNPEKYDSVAELPIPWRTSRRLQEATYRLIQERDGGHATNSASASKQKHSQGSKCGKREHSVSDSELESSELTEEGKEEKKQMGESRKKRKSVHFSDPLVVYIDDKKQSTSSPGKASPRKSEEGDEPAQVTTSSAPKQIMSCFDLFCNHVGPKGWRCYRICTEGSSYCNYHQTSNASIVRISVCT